MKRFHFGSLVAAGAAVAAGAMLALTARSHTPDPTGGRPRFLRCDRFSVLKRPTPIP